jgi:saccharopine dehydrogenase-like NADP-dependent oxidoreductase
MALMKALSRAGLLSEMPIRIDGNEMPAIETVRALLSASPTARENDVCAYGLVVEVYGERAGRRVKCTHRNHHPPQEEWGGQAAYYKNVGVPLSIGAQLIASGETPARGVLPPEQAFPTEPFFTQLARRGITVEEAILDEGLLSSSKEQAH